MKKLQTELDQQWTIYVWQWQQLHNHHIIVIIIINNKNQSEFTSQNQLTLSVLCELYMDFQSLIYSDVARTFSQYFSDKYFFIIAHLCHIMDNNKLADWPMGGLLHLVHYTGDRVHSVPIQLFPHCADARTKYTHPSCGQCTNYQQSSLYEYNRANGQLYSSTFGVAGPRLWNALPISLRQSDLSLGQFRRALKTHFFDCVCRA